MSQPTGPRVTASAPSAGAAVDHGFPSATPGHTFEVFVRTIGIWWPVDPFSAGQDRVRDVIIERAGRPGLRDLGRRHRGGLGRAAGLGSPGQVRDDLEPDASAHRGGAELRGPRRP